MKSTPRSTGDWLALETSGEISLTRHDRMAGTIHSTFVKTQAALRRSGQSKCAGRFFSVLFRKCPSGCPAPFKRQIVKTPNRFPSLSGLRSSAQATLQSDARNVTTKGIGRAAKELLSIIHWGRYCYPPQAWPGSGVQETHREN